MTTRLRPLAGAMSIDVEEHFHAAALAPSAPRDAWDMMESRVVDSTRRCLDIFAAAGARATFFTLGMVAEKHPALIREIVAAGHELASHGHAHFRITEQDPATFRADVSRAKRALEDAGGVEVRGYRAPNFSLDRTTWWAYDILAETGHGYSSSVNPVAHDHYGMPDAPQGPFDPGAGGVVELPVTTVSLGRRRLHASGGGWFRLMPFPVFRSLLTRLPADRPAVFYFHPWEVDPDQPKLAVPLKARFRHYVNLTAMAGKLQRLMAIRSWSRMDAVFSDEIAGRIALPRWHPVQPQGNR